MVLIRVFMEFVALGNTSAIGASCLYLKVNQTGIMLDAGADPEHDGAASLPRFDVLKRRPGWYVDHAIVTHAHHDHLGALPVAVREFPHVIIHMTKATRQLADVLLPASARLQRRKQREGSTQSAPLFSEEELELHSYLYLTHELEQNFALTGMRDPHPITGTFYNSGHILGAVGVLVSFTEDGTPRRLFYTSDTNLRPQGIIPGGRYPEEPVDVLILESTLGADPDAEMTTRKTEENRFAEAVGRVIARGGTVLVPVFALGRAQEILALIDRFKSRGIVPRDVPVYTAGSQRAVSDLYDKTRFATPRLNPEFQVFGVEQRRLPRSERATLNALSEPSIHVMSSGMMFEHTISNRLARRLVEDEKNGIFLVGFAKEDSPARRLLEAAEAGPGAEVVLEKSTGPQPLRCDVGRFRFSGHSHRRDLIKIVEQLKPKTVLLVHGEEDARAWMADNLRFFYPDLEIHLPEFGEPIQV